MEPSDDALRDQVQAELKLLQPIVSRIVGGVCRWNGSVTLTDDPKVLGRKRYSCGIEIAARIVGSESRWRTLIHELLHAHSAGMSMSGVQQYRGWEEGLAENLQRIIRSQVLTEIGVTVDEAAFADEKESELEPFVLALEEWRVALVEIGGDNRTAQVFYSQLLQVPVAKRPADALRWAMEAPPEVRSSLIRVYSLINSRLR